MNALDFLMDQHNVVSRINPAILGAERKYIHFRPTSGNSFLRYDSCYDFLFFFFFILTCWDFHFAVPFDVEDLSTFSFLDSQDKSAVISDNMKYLTNKGIFIFYIGFLFLYIYICVYYKLLKFASKISEGIHTNKCTSQYPGIFFQEPDHILIL